MKDIVVSTTYLDLDGKLHKIENKDHEFAYRSSRFSNTQDIIISTTLSLQKGDKKQIKEKMDEYAQWRKEKQPLEYPSAGSTFKRGDGFITAALIDECGLKGYTIGGAQVSQKHAGFVINKGNATAENIIQLVEDVKKQVYEKFQKTIELEVKIIGEDACS